MSSPDDICLAREPLAQLKREWMVVVSKLAAVWPGWQQQEAALAAFASPQLLLRFLQCPGSDVDAKDAALAALLRRAPSNPLAGRLVLQALLPGLEHLGARLSRRQGGRAQAELWSTLLAALWARIHSYPLQRRPQRIAANLLLDTRVEVRRERERTRRWLRRQIPLVELPLPRPGLSFALERPLRRAVDAGAISAEEAELIAETRIDGIPLAALATTAGIAYDALRLRRSRAEQRLEAFWEVPGRFARSVSGAKSTFL